MVRPPPSLLALAVLEFAACRAFPVGVLVPDTVLDALAHAAYEEELDEVALAGEITRRAGVPVAPAAEPSSARFWRLDAEPVQGPFAPEAFESANGAASAGLAPGDLVLVKNGRAQSLGTTLSLAEFTFYDHMGVLAELAGELLVCDSWPSFHPLAKAEDFADRFRGGARATPLGTFLAHYETLLVVRLPDAERNTRLAEVALASLAEEIVYDPRHDPADPRLSCAEYVQWLLGRVGYEPPVAPREVSADPELGAVLDALGFPVRGFLVPDQFGALPGARTVGWISAHRSRAGALAIESAFALLHARFLAGGRVADFLGIDRFRLLRYRSNVRLFLAFAEGWAEARGVADRARLERELETLLPLFFSRSAGNARLQPGSSFFL